MADELFPDWSTKKCRSIEPNGGWHIGGWLPGSTNGPSGELDVARPMHINPSALSSCV